MKQCIKDSIIFEGDIPKTKIVNNVYDYINTNVTVDILELVKLFSPDKNLIRHEDVFVGLSFYLDETRPFKCDMVGMNYKDLNFELINMFINSKPEDISDAFRKYIQFELIHPFEDCNGRIGRLLMIEKPLDICLSSKLMNGKNKKLHNDLFRSVCGKRIKLYKVGDELYDYKTKKPYKYKTFDDIAKFELTNEMKKIIDKILN